MFYVLYGALSAGIGTVLLILALLERQRSRLAWPAVAVMAAFLVNIVAETAIGTIVVSARDHGGPLPAEYALQIVSFVGVYGMAIAASWLATRLFPFAAAGVLLATQVGAQTALFAVLLLSLFDPGVSVGGQPVMLLLDIPVTVVFVGWVIAGAVHMVRTRGHRDDKLGHHRRVVALAVTVIPLSLAVDLYSLPQRLGLFDGPAAISPLLICVLGLAVVYSTRTRATPGIQSGAWEAELSSREREVARMLAEGKTYAQIGDALFIAPSTVKTRALRIYRKLGVANKTELSRVIGQ